MTEFRPGRFQILPTVIKNLIIINVLVFLAQLAVGDSFNFETRFALHTWQSPYFRIWQFFTYMFLHANWPHIIFNMLALWMFGSTLENLWGPKRFLTFYIACGLGAALCNMLVVYIQTQAMLSQFDTITSESALRAFMDKYNHYPELPFTLDGARTALAYNLNTGTLGASGAVFGCLAAFGYLFPNDYIYLYFSIPVKAKWVVLGYIGVELFLQIKSSPGDNIAHLAHLGGALIGFLLAYFWNKNNRRRVY